MTGSAGTIFECSNGRLSLDGRTVLDDVSFALRKGEFVALLGDNGAGKTTLVKALLGLLPLMSGSIRIMGCELPRFRRWDKIGYVPQRLGAASPVPATVGEVVLSGRASVARRLPGYSKLDRRLARQALEAVRMESTIDRPVASLSGGQQQRVLIARALSREPEVLILDEPAAGIDAESQDALADTLRRLSPAGVSVLMVAHGLGPVASLVSRAVVLDAGRVIYDGPPVEAVAERHLHIHHHPEHRPPAVFEDRG